MLLAPHNEPPNEATKRRYGGHNSDSKLYEADEAPAERATSASTPVQEVVMRRRITSSSEDGQPPKVDEAETASAICVGKCFFDYEAKQEDELSFKRGSIVEILDKNPGERGWVYGQINGVKGMIPENYVHLVGKQPTIIKGTEFECSWLSNDEVGGGASSRVYRGRWNNHEVALKKIKPTSKDKDQAIIEALKREALIYARLNHKNIVQFYGICYDEPPCLLLELCKGKTLFSLYRQLTYSVPSFVVYWALQIARAMSCMHELDEALIHADLKADNVLIKEEPCLCDHDEKIPRALNEKNYDREGKCLRCKKTALNRLTLKLTDFGLSRPEKATQGGFAGSVPWMSPELVRDGFHSKEADVWAFGVVIWELVTNQIPHQEFEGHLLHAAIGGQNVTPKIPDDCPRYLEDIMRACWQIKPKDRPTFTQLTKMLANVQNNPVDNVKRPNNRDSLKRIQHRREDIRELEEMIQRNAIDTSQYASYQPARLYPPASGPNTRRPKITKDTIGSPTGFKHMVAVRVADSASKPKAGSTGIQNFLVEYPQEESKGRHHSPVGISNSDGGKPLAVSDDTQNLTLPRNYKHSTSIIEPAFNKSSNTLIDSCNGSHEDVGDSEESNSSSHLRPLRFGRPPKAFKSNPELSGLSVNRSRLERSNARRKRNVEVVHPSKTEPALLDDCVIDLSVDFHTGSPQFRNRSESNDTAFESPSPRGSGRKKKNSSSSTFYVDEDGSSISQESTQTSGSKKKGVLTWFKNKKEKGREVKSPRSTTSSESAAESGLQCDRPRLPVCIHPNHSKYLQLYQPHICGTADNDFFYPQKDLSPRPEIHVEKPGSSSGQRSYLKAKDDPLRARHAVSTMPSNVPQTPGSRTVSQQVVAQRRHHYDEKSSENESSFERQSSTETMTGAESDSLAVEPLRSPFSQSQQDLQSFSYEQASTVHLRSRSSDQPAVDAIDDGGPVCVNRTYVKSVVDPDLPPPAPISKTPTPTHHHRHISSNTPIPPPHARTEPSDLGSLLHGYENISPHRSKANCPIPPAKSRTHSDISATHVHSHHKKPSALEQPVVGSRSHDAHPHARYEQATRRPSANTPISPPERSSNWEPENDQMAPIVNRTYKSQNHKQDLPPPIQRAPLPPNHSSRVPRYLPRSSAQFPKNASKP